MLAKDSMMPLGNLAVPLEVSTTQTSCSRDSVGWSTPVHYRHKWQGTYVAHAQKNLMLAKDSMTPLGSPVVPLEVSTTQTSCSRDSLGWSTGRVCSSGLNCFTNCGSCTPGSSSNKTTFLTPLRLGKAVAMFLHVNAEQNITFGLLIPNTWTISSEIKQTSE